MLISILHMQTNVICTVKDLQRARRDANDNAPQLCDDNQIASLALSSLPPRHIILLHATCSSPNIANAPYVPFFALFLFRCKFNTIRHLLFIQI